MTPPAFSSYLRWTRLAGLGRSTVEQSRPEAPLWSVPFPPARGFHVSGRNHPDADRAASERTAPHVRPRLLLLPDLRLRRAKRRLVPSQGGRS